jgi:hypothetical protein
MTYNSRTNKGTPMITTETILELAKTCGFDSFTPEDRVCWEDQLIEFAVKIHEMGYNEGNDDGWESREEAEYFNRSSYPSGLVGDPQ